MFSVVRILTFFLSCWLACAVCCGLSVAIIAGVAYGYNYCLAEFIALTRSDVKIYMRRGQFYDKPDSLFNHIRSSDDNGAFASNLNEEYEQEVPAEDNSLTENWEKDQDARKYAEKLTKYSDSKNNFIDSEQSDTYQQQEDDPNSIQWKKNQDGPSYASENTFTGNQVTEGNIYDKITTPPARRVSILPNPIILTTVIQSGSSEIVMRKFEPISNILPETSDEVDEYDDKSLRVIDTKTDLNTVLPEDIERRTLAVSHTIRIRLEDSPTRKLIKMRHWGTSSKPVISEYSTDVDEDNVIYKTV